MSDSAVAQGLPQALFNVTTPLAMAGILGDNATASDDAPQVDLVTVSPLCTVSDWFAILENSTCSQNCTDGELVQARSVLSTRDLPSTDGNSTSACDLDLRRSVACSPHTCLSQLPRRSLISVLIS